MRVDERSHVQGRELELCSTDVLDVYVIAQCINPFMKMKMTDTEAQSSKVRRDFFTKQVMMVTAACH